MPPASGSAYTGAGENARAAGNNARELTAEEVDRRWESTIKSIDEQIDNYREALMDRGIPDCKWLKETLARHRVAMTEQEGYILDLASGNVVKSTNSKNAYQYPADYHVFYDQLTNDFRQYCLDVSNPHYNTAPQWNNNCQRCVPVLEMLRRGKDVTAQPSTYGSDHLSYYPFDVWENSDVIRCKNSGVEDIKNAMNSWGDGARAQVVVYWNSPHGGGHTFIAEQINGKTIFSDPQNGKFDVSEYFDRVVPNETQFCRIDNLNFSEHIEECYKEV